MNLLKRIGNSNQPRKLFFIDSAGAFISGTLNLIVARYEPVFGIPAAILHALSVIAYLFCLYSLVCGLWIRRGWQHCMQVIALANLLYCSLTIYRCWISNEDITLWGVAYLVAETGIVIGLSTLEWGTAERNKSIKPSSHT